MALTKSKSGVRSPTDACDQEESDLLVHLDSFYNSIRFLKFFCHQAKALPFRCFC